jgi:hypothetical protein
MAEQTVPATPIASVPQTIPQATSTSTATATPEPKPAFLKATKTIYKQEPASAYSANYRAGFVRLGPEAPPPVPPPDKYHSIHTLQQSQKIDTLKNTKLNPNLIEDGYDQLAHGLHLWTVVGAKAQADPNISFDEQKKIAGNFYDRIIGPAYGHLGMAPMSKDLWLHQAYEDGLKYDISSAYTNNWTQSLKHGWNTGLAAMSRAADRVSTMAGYALRDAVGQFRKESLALGGMDKPQTMNWMQRVREIDSQVDLDNKYDTTAIQRGARWQAAHRQFWADALPAHDGFLNKTTNFVAEQVAQLPVFLAMGPLGAEGLLGKALTGTALGARVSGYLLAGTEGLAYGALTRKQDDPGEILRDGIGFFVFHGLFDIGGLGLKKLSDVVPPDSKLGAALAKRAKTLDLSQQGLRPATPVETYDAHKTEVANNLFAGGTTTQRAIYVDALHYIQTTEEMPAHVERAHSADLLGADPERWAPVLSSVKYIRALLGDRKLSDIKPGSEEEKYLGSRMAQLIVDAGSEMNTRVKGMAQDVEASVPEKLAEPGAKLTLDYYVKQVQADLAKNPGAAKMVTPEMVQKAAQKKYAKALQAAAEDAEKETSVDKPKKAANAAERRKDKAPKLATDTQLSTKRTANKKGEPSVQFKAESYKARFAAHKAAAKANGQSLTEFFKGMDEHDFMFDLSHHFYPQALKDADIYFEGQGKYSKTGDKILPMISKPFAGMQNPNFLAFMRNYTSQMPKEFADALQDHLIDTVKVQKYMSGRTPTENQLDYYAGAMYNHMDNLLGSGRWPAEHNVFRSSNESIFKTTKYQRQLLIEKTLQEQKNLKEMYSGDAKATKTALTAHAVLSKLRLNEFDNASMKRDSQTKIRALDTQISDLQTKTGYFERFKF